MLAKSKLNRLKTLTSQALTDMEIIHIKNILWFLRRKINIKRWKKMWGMSMKNEKKTLKYETK